MPLALASLKDFVEPHAMLLGFIGGAIAVAIFLWKRDFFLRGVPELSAEALGLFRVFYALAMIIALNYWDQRGPLSAGRDYPWWGSWHWIDSYATNPDLVNAVQIVGTVALVMFAAGFLTRIALTVSTAMVAMYVLFILEAGGAHSWGLPLVAMLSLNLVRGWGDGFSVDEAIRRWRGRADPAPKRGTGYGLGVWLPGALWGIAFLAAAFAKVRNSGFEWGLGGAVQYHFVEDGLYAPTHIGWWIASHPFIASVFSTGALFIEASFIGHAFFKSSWVRLGFATAAFGILVGFFLFQGVFWFPWWALLLVLLPWEEIWKAASGAFARYVVLVDGRCPLCLRTSRRLAALDWLNRLEFADATDHDALRRFAPGVSTEDAVADMHVVRIDDGRVFKGFDAYAHLSRSTFLLWPLAVVAAIPGLSHLGSAVYGTIAKRRTREECTDESCVLHGSGKADRPVLPSRWRAAQTPIRAAYGIPLLIFLTVIVFEQTTVSIAGKEREPLMTNFPMYSYTSPNRDDFDEKAALLPRFNDFRFEAREGGREKDVTEAMKDTGYSDLFKSVVLDPTYEPDSDSLKAARDRYRREFGTNPPSEVEAQRIRIVFDWDAGKFRRVPLHERTALSTITGGPSERSRASSGAIAGA